MNPSDSGPGSVVPRPVVPQLGLGPQLRWRRAPGGRNRLDAGSARRAMDAAGWDGDLLPLADVLGARVYPVVQYTGATARIEHGSAPERCLVTLELWEMLASSAAPEVQPAPLRIVGFVASSGSWRQAMRQLEVVAGLGAGLIAHPGRGTQMQALEANATDVWMVDGVGATEGARVLVRGRRGPVASARRVPATRLMEEGLFAHAIESGRLGVR